MSECRQAEALRDYAFDELAAGERRSMEQHIAGCAACAGELDQLRVTTAALRALPDREIPQRIAFVSDKVFAPSVWARFWSSTARLGFASACILGGALVVSAYHRPAEIRTVVQTVSAPVDVSSQVNQAVAKAVAQVRAEVQAEDADRTKALLAAVDRKNEQEHRSLVDAVMVMRDHMNRDTLLASFDTRQTTGQTTGAGQ